MAAVDETGPAAHTRVALVARVAPPAGKARAAAVQAGAVASARAPWGSRDRTRQRARAIVALKAGIAEATAVPARAAASAAVRACLQRGARLARVTGAAEAPLERTDASAGTVGSARQRRGTVGACEAWVAVALTRLARAVAVAVVRTRRGYVARGAGESGQAEAPAELATAVARARCSSAPLHCRLATGLVRRPLHAGAVLREGLGGAAAVLRRAPAKRQRRCPHERMACRWRHWRPQRIWWSGSSRRGRLRSNSRDLCRGCRVAR